MLKSIFGDLSDKIQFKEVLQETKDDLILSLANGHTVVNMIGEDSYTKLQPQTLRRPNTRWIVFRRIGQEQNLKDLPENVTVRALSGISEAISSTDARHNISKPGIEKILSPEVLNFIQTHNLYRSHTGPRLLDLQMGLYRNSFESFKSDLIVAFPKIDFSKMTPPTFNDVRSAQATAETFIRTSVETAQLPTDQLSSFWTQLRKLLFSFPGGVPTPKLSWLETSCPPTTTEKNPVIDTRPVPSIKLQTSEAYAMDIKSYAGDRFAPAFIEFLNSNHAKIYLHKGSGIESTEFHRQQGFETFYRIRQIKNLESKVSYLAYSKSSNKYRSVISSLSGSDRSAQVLSQLTAAGFKGSGTEIIHKKLPPLFRLSLEGESLRLNSDDLILIGFKNHIEYDLRKLGWTNIPLTSNGLEMSLMTHSEGKRIVLIKNVYGDEMKTVLDFISEKGAKRLVYLGTTGALKSDVKVGDILLPDQTYFNGKTVRFENDQRLLGTPTDPALKIHTHIQQGWVQTLLTETKKFLESSRMAGIAALDVETLYIAEFLQRHPEINGSVALIVSDLPLGELTYDKHQATMDLVNKSLESLLPGILNKKLKEMNERPMSKKMLPSEPLCSDVFSG